MPSLTIKNIPDDLYQQIKQSATTHRRSINSELIVGLEKVFLPTCNSPAKHIAAAQEIREALAAYQFDTEDIQRAKEDGRS